MANKLFSQLSKGAYDNATAYTVGDFINYLGSSYACIKNGTGNLPTNTTYWALLSSKGDKGDTGATGADGSNGACVESVAFVGDDMVFTLTDASTVTLVGAKTDLKGEHGLDVTWLGEYNAGTTYVVNDAVSYNGSSYICKLESTGNLPTNTTYFDLMARKGTDGAGLGDVIAPATNTDSYIPQWDGVNTKTLKDGIPTSTFEPAKGVDDFYVTSAEKTTWSGKQDALGFTPENVVNKRTSFQATPTDTAYPSEKLVKDSLDLKDTTTSLTKYSNLNISDGFLINGKIVPSVASNNLTVAIKGMNGNDPSASNPVYVRIGDTIRSITSALSVTKNAGTNWCNAGSAELATKEIDYFVYLGYNTTDGVVIGFSRIPYARVYSDFSATSTNEKYAGISTITNATAGDNYVNIGRFAATLSAGAGYTWSVPTFTNTNLIQRPIYETRQLSWTPSISYNGGTTNPTSNTIQSGTFYLINGKILNVYIQSYLVKGSGNRSYTIFTAPFVYGVAIPCNGLDNITAVGNTSALTCYTENNTVVYKQTMANDGSYYIFSVSSL